MPLLIRPATSVDLAGVVPLFDAYRQFYGQAEDHDRARAFLAERLVRSESVLLVALDGDSYIGFTQLYPMFSSVRTARTFVLNDLFVAASARRQGIAAALIQAAVAHAHTLGAAGLSLSTAHDNLAAQRLYESLGWQRDMHFREYTFAIA
ncbi:GNAT family N-acetyltransferase [Dyella sp.]|uniref:GNAT family N-acetyltransferase n=1 Tax=Dyella sp. TaxID=1869338 RepID=UPI002ED277F9